MRDGSCTSRCDLNSTNSVDRSSEQFHSCERHHLPNQKLLQQDRAASTSGSSSNQRRPVRILERYPSRLPDRTPVLPKRVINLRFEHYQQQHLTSYIVESLPPLSTVPVGDDHDHDDQGLYLKRGSSLSTTADRTNEGKKGDELLYHISKSYVRSPSPLGG